MSATFKLEIVTPDGLAFEGDVTALQARAYEGYLGVLAHHAPMVCSLEPGRLRITQEGKTTSWSTGGGFLEVTRAKTLVLVTDVKKS